MNLNSIKSRLPKHRHRLSNAMMREIVRTELSPKRLSKELGYKVETINGWFAKFAPAKPEKEPTKNVFHITKKVERVSVDLPADWKLVLPNGLQLTLADYQAIKNS